MKESAGKIHQVEGQSSFDLLGYCPVREGHPWETAWWLSHNYPVHLSNSDRARAVYAAQEFDEIIWHGNACMHLHHPCMNIILLFSTPNSSTSSFTLYPLPFT